MPIFVNENLDFWHLKQDGPERNQIIRYLQLFPRIKDSNERYWDGFVIIEACSSAK
jgi:hypothetical protein